MGYGLGEAVCRLRVRVDLCGEHFASANELVDLAVLDVDVARSCPVWIVFTPAQRGTRVFKYRSGVGVRDAEEFVEASEPHYVACAMVDGDVLGFCRGERDVALPMARPHDCGASVDD